MNSLTFTKATFESAFKKISEERGVYNFLNLYSVYLFKKEKVFRNSLIKSTNYLDGATPALFLSLKTFKKVNRLSGPVFTRKFLESSEAKKKKIMFVGNCNKKDLGVFSKKFKILLKNLFCYDKLPFIAPKIEFSREDIRKLSKEIKLKKIDYCFVCVGNPRQEILSYELNNLVKIKYFSVGAALDFLLERKKEAPKIVRELYLEWLYRLITDFRYSWRKVWRSLVGLGYLVGGRVGLDISNP